MSSTLLAVRHCRAAFVPLRAVRVFQGRNRQFSVSTTLQIRKATVTDGDITRLAAKPLHPLTLADLVKHGRPPLSENALLASANFTLSILPTRLAHRIQSLRSLPYIVVSNPQISKIHSNYVHSLSTLLPYASNKITTLEEEIQFTEVMADLVQTHSDTISILARGFLEARKYIGPKEVGLFLDEHLRARIGTRLIAEQHIALHFSSAPHAELYPDARPPPKSYIGAIDTALRPADIIRNCEGMVGDICEFRYGVRPHVVIDGEPDYEFAHIPMHLEYILTELLKNAFRAQIENGKEREGIEVTIAPAPEEPIRSATGGVGGVGNAGLGAKSHDGISNVDQGSVDLASGANKPEKAASENIRMLERGTPGVTIRIRDRGGGISPTNLERLWQFGFTTFNEDEISDATGAAGASMSTGAGLDAIQIHGGGGSIAGLGYGLPLGRAYAEYFGGAVAVQSLWGWGTDVYLSLRGVGIRGE